MLLFALVYSHQERYVSKNMSLLKARAPGVLPSIFATVVCMACIAVARAWSTMSRAWVIFAGGLLYKYVLSTFATVWCIRSQMELDCRFFAVDCMSLMLHIFSSHWKLLPMNSLPLLCAHRIGCGYLDNQDCTTCFGRVLLSYCQCGSTRLNLMRYQCKLMRWILPPYFWPWLSKVQLNQCLLLPKVLFTSFVQVISHNLFLLTCV